MHLMMSRMMLILLILQRILLILLILPILLLILLLILLRSHCLIHLPLIFRHHRAVSTRGRTAILTSKRGCRGAINERQIIIT